MSGCSTPSMSRQRSPRAYSTYLPPLRLSSNTTSTRDLCQERLAGLRQYPPIRKGFPYRSSGIGSTYTRTPLQKSVSLFRRDVIPLPQFSIPRHDEHGTMANAETTAIRRTTRIVSKPASITGIVKRRSLHNEDCSRPPSRPPVKLKYRPSLTEAPANRDSMSGQRPRYMRPPGSDQDG